jgi:hypothetical protein
MSGYEGLLERLDEAHKEEQEFNKETYGEFDPEEGTLYKDAATAIRELTAPPKPLEFGPLKVGDRVEVLHDTGHLKSGDTGVVSEIDKTEKTWPYVIKRDDGRDGAFARHELRKVS